MTSAPETVDAVGPPAEVGPTAAPRLRDQHAFLRVWAGQSAGAVTDQLIPVALSVYAASKGGQVGDIGLILGGRTIALVACLLVGGALADRLPRPRLLVSADWLRAAVLLAAGVSLAGLPLWSLALVTALLGAGEAISRPPMRSLAGDLLPDPLLESGNALIVGSQRAAAVVGALVAVALVHWWGARGGLLVSAVALLVGGATVVSLRDPRGRVRPQASARKEYGVALAAVTKHRWVLAVMLMASLHLFAGSAPALVTLPIVAERHFGGDGVYAAALAAMAAGALPGVALTSAWRPRRPGLVGIGGLLAFALVPLSVAFPVSPVAVIAAFALGGFTIEVYFVYWVSALQRTFPGEVLGKVFALDQVTAYAMLPVGQLAVGPLVAWLGITSTLTAGGVIVFAATVTTLLVPGVLDLGARDRAARAAEAS